jgi:membrane protein
MLRLVATCRPIVTRFVSVGFIQHGIVLAAQAFMALFPLLIGIIAFAPSGTANEISSLMRSRFGLGAETGGDVQQLVATRSELRSGISVIGLIVVLASATSFTRALQRVYERSWDLPTGGIRGSVRGLFWLIGLVIYLSMIALVFRLTRSQAPGVGILRDSVLVAFSLALWWLTPFVLLCGRVQMRAIAATAVLTTIVFSIASGVSGVIVPRIIASNERKYGAIGVVFAIQSWLVIMAEVIVGAAFIGALLTQSDNWIGRLARGTADVDGWHRVPTGRFAAKPKQPSARKKSALANLVAEFAAAGAEADSDPGSSATAASDAATPPVVGAPEPVRRPGASSDPG